MYAVFLYDMHDNEYLSAEEPHTDKALFVIILTSIFNGSDEAVKNQSGIGKRDTVFHIASPEASMLYIPYCTQLHRFRYQRHTMSPHSIGTAHISPPPPDLKSPVISAI